MKLLEYNIRENLGDFGYGDDFLDTTPKIWSMQEITDKLDFIKIKNMPWQRHYQKNSKTSHRLGENVCERYIW